MCFDARFRALFFMDMKPFSRSRGDIFQVGCSFLLRRDLSLSCKSFTRGEGRKVPWFDLCTVSPSTRSPGDDVT